MAAGRSAGPRPRYILAVAVTEKHEKGEKKHAIASPYLPNRRLLQINFSSGKNEVKARNEDRATMGERTA